MTTVDVVDVAVVGSGVTGSSIAYHLVKRGAKVVVVDRDGALLWSADVPGTGPEA